MQVLGSQTEMRSIDHRTHFAVDMGTIYCSVNSTVSVSPVARVSGHSIFLSRFPTLILMYRRAAVHTKQGSDETDHIQCPSGPNTLLNLLSGAHSSRVAKIEVRGRSVRSLPRHPRSVRRGPDACMARTGVVRLTDRLQIRNWKYYTFFFSETGQRGRIYATRRSAHPSPAGDPAPAPSVIAPNVVTRRRISYQ